MKYKAVLFDLDGTLLNTLDDLADSMNHVLAARGFPSHPVDAYRYFIGSGAKALASRVLPADAGSSDEQAACLAAFRDRYSENWNVKTRPYPGIGELLDALTARGLPLAVFTNKPHEFATLCVRDLLAGWTFRIVLGQKDGVPVKPDPAGALGIARDLGVQPEDVLYLGDTGTDMQTAVAAGMFPVGVLWGFRPEAELREHGAAVTFKAPMEVVELLA